jgi:hypothetical protein
MARADKQFFHPVQWRSQSKSTACQPVIRTIDGQAWVHFLDSNGKTIGYFHPDDIDDIVEALKAAQDQIGH